MRYTFGYVLDVRELRKLGHTCTVFPTPKQETVVQSQGMLQNYWSWRKRLHRNIAKTMSRAWLRSIAERYPFPDAAVALWLR